MPRQEGPSGPTDSATEPQNYSVAIVVLTADKKTTFLFGHSGSALTASSDKWDLTTKNAAISENWLNLKAGATASVSGSDSSDLGSILDGILKDLETVLGWAVQAVAVFS